MSALKAQLVDCRQECRSQAAEIASLKAELELRTRERDQYGEFIKSIMGLVDMLERCRGWYPDAYAHLAGRGE